MQAKFLIFSLLIGSNWVGGAAAQNISTIAGGGPHNQPATIGLGEPSALAVDTAGNLYVAVSRLNQIWKINTSGQVNVFAGTGGFLYNGDNRQALSAALYQPFGLAFDNAGNLYVADTGHHRIRKIATSGVITTVAGTGAASFGGDGGLGTSAQLNKPQGIAFDASNNLYIADSSNNRVRVLSSAGVINTFAGNGTPTFGGETGQAINASLSGPRSVAVDPAGAVYIADLGNFRIRKVAIGGVISTIAGNGTNGLSGDGGPATSAQLNYLSGIAVDQFGNIYISEAADVRKIAAGQSNIVTFAGGATPGFSGDGGSATAGTFKSLAAVALDSSAQTVYLADLRNNRIRKVNGGTVTTFAGNGTPDYYGSPQVATDASLLTPNTLAIDNAGTLLFSDGGSSSVLSDGGSSSIRKLALPSGVLSTVTGTGSLGFTPDGGAVTGPVSQPVALTFDPKGNYYFVEGNRVRKVSGGVYSTVGNVSGTGDFSGDGGPATAAHFSFPSGLALAANGDLYVADAGNYRVRVISGSTGVVTTVAGNGGIGTSTGDGGVATSASLNYPTALALDGNGNLFIGELQGNRVRKVALNTTIISTAAGDGSATYVDGVAATATGISVPFSIFADQSSNLFIADEGHGAVRKVTAATGLISTVAGNGTRDFAGDGGPATAASIDPIAITIDRSQNLYIADSSGRIRTTPVLACFFTLSTPTFYINKSGGTGSVTMTATNSSCPYSVSNSSPFVTVTSGTSGIGSGTITFSVTADSGTNRTATVSVGGQSFAVAQAGVFGQSNVGIFQPTNGPLWLLDANGNGVFDSGDKFFSFAGQPGVIAVTGDWNGDGRAKVGYYMDGFWVLDYNGNGIYDSADKFYAFGGPSSSGYVPVVGDWNGDGRTKIGYYRYGFWLLDTNGSGVFDAGDAYYAFGGNGAGEFPLVGDWNGDGRSKIGYFYHGTWLLDYNGDGLFTAADKYYNSFTYYLSTDLPVTGDWNGDGKAKIGIYREGFWILDYNGNGTYEGTGPGQDKFYAFGGHPGDVPIYGDWSGDGRIKIGLYNNGFWTLDFNGNGSYDGTGQGGDRFLAFGGTPGNQLIIGRW